MKIAIGYKLNKGPWGGGNQFAISLEKKLLEEGHQVFFNLSRNDLDIILLTDPRKRSSCVSFSSGDIIKYLIFKNSKAIVVHRISEDELSSELLREMVAHLASANHQPRDREGLVVNGFQTSGMTVLGVDKPGTLLFWAVFSEKSRFLRFTQPLKNG